MLTVDTIQRVFRIKAGSKTGSSYTIEKGEQQFLVSASHLFKELRDITEIEIYHESKWKKLPVKTILNLPDAGDTIVFKLPHPISSFFPVTFGPDRVLLGSQAYILGFPLGLMNQGGDLNNNFPLPFIKGGLVSAIQPDGHGIVKIYLDAQNNKGFSGGPIVWHENGDRKRPQIIGTIHGYEFEFPVHSKTQEDYDLWAVNSGITIGYWIKDLFELLK